MNVDYESLLQRWYLILNLQKCMLRIILEQKIEGNLIEFMSAIKSIIPHKTNLRNTGFL